MVEINNPLPTIAGSSKKVISLWWLGDREAAANELYRLCLPGTIIPYLYQGLMFKERRPRWPSMDLAASDSDSELEVQIAPDYMITALLTDDLSNSRWVGKQEWSIREKSIRGIYRSYETNWKLYVEM